MQSRGRSLCLAVALLCFILGATLLPGGRSGDYGVPAFLPMPRRPVAAEAPYPAARPAAGELQEEEISELPSQDAAEPQPSQDEELVDAPGPIETEGGEASGTPSRRPARGAGAGSRSNALLNAQAWKRGAAGKAGAMGNKRTPPTAAFVSKKSRPPRPAAAMRHFAPHPAARASNASGPRPKPSAGRNASRRAPAPSPAARAPLEKDAGAGRLKAPASDRLQRALRTRNASPTGGARSESPKAAAKPAAAGSRTARRAERGASRNPAKARPASFLKALGRGALKPPPEDATPPDFSGLEAKRPFATPDGKLIGAEPAPLQELDGLAPPDREPAHKEWEKKEARSRKANWHEGGGGRLYLHDGKAWGVLANGYWSWMLEKDRHWWILAGGRQPLIEQSGRWWFRTEDGWFILHEGQPWGFRWFHDWKQQGFIHPISGTRVVYTQDGKRAAVVVPGQGAELFDLKTGEKVGEWTEEQVAAAKPKVPSKLQMP